MSLSLLMALGMFIGVSMEKISDCGDVLNCRKFMVSMEKVFLWKKFLLNSPHGHLPCLNFCRLLSGNRFLITHPVFVFCLEISAFTFESFVYNTRISCVAATPSP